MAFLSGFVKSGLSLLGKDSAAFAYTVGPRVESYDGLSIWTLHQGRRFTRVCFCFRLHQRQGQE
ncbi:hypothetical protein BCR43DRAFT_344014 [Syncephalastrum racemosum]|uniref:Uncharacterized protein n=1 Tax=Syncephalastrum racemosum TaxID=13706 RepID=A0A1X2H5H4_SYNRA|nr:hypothetical protein BCR43DRAFT_344014 [Syncephalastrum racemosum]